MKTILIHAVIIGIGATAVMDIWTLTQQRVFGVPVLDYAMVGRWIGHLRRGHVRHDSIATAAPIAGEGLIGWTAHYAIGIAFAGLLLGIWGVSWARTPSLVPALIVGLGTVAAPFLILQPALGADFAASRTPRPNLARLRSLITHVVFGIGLFVAAEAWSRLNGH
ncbi:DUF2938 domain-containing protein [Bradyrhizobium prioriisuperbiae]|uniref:DUF2938 domain-containing protein n=1 Tax=Bradyrhizobium prioriisuperbiae TaxID=2854389 RepID=UPI0028EF02A5|nr:DUF2938 domain-containing protein [Bradyrhizobium prioritasuperba]